jgi:hypothetical protein
VTSDPEQFVWMVVPCASREAARAEAERRQAVDTSEATWIYLRINGQWVAKRTPTDVESEEWKPRGRADRIASAVINFFLPGPGGSY